MRKIIVAAVTMMIASVVFATPVCAAEHTEYAAKQATVEATRHQQFDGAAYNQGFYDVEVLGKDYTAPEIQQQLLNETSNVPEAAEYARYFMQGVNDALKQATK